VATPFELLAQRRPPTVASLSMVQAMANHLEQRCAIDPEPAVVVASLPDDQLMSGGALAKLQITARNTAFVAALLRDRVPYPIPGVRTAVIGRNDNLHRESNIAVVGPHFSALLTARTNPRATGPSDAQLVGISHHRDIVLHAARTLLQRFTNADGG
jgi:hypothetical protein